MVILIDITPIDLHLIFENQVWKIKLDELDFGLFQTWIFRGSQAVKIEFEINQKSSSSNWIFQKSSADQQGDNIVQSKES